MKRFMTPATILGLALTAGLAGCSEEAKVERETTIEGPGGTSTITDTKSVESTGDNPPINVNPTDNTTTPSSTTP